MKLKLVDDNDNFRGLRTEGQRLRRARDMAGLSGPVLAHLLGITRSALSQMETDRIRIPPAKMTALTQILATSEPWLKRGIGMPPRFPERPVFVPEMDLDHADLSPELLNGAGDDRAWLRYRTPREWGLPFSEAQRLDISPHRGIVVRVNEPLSPKITPGDHVLLDRDRTQVVKSLHYGLIINQQFILAGIAEADRKSMTLVRGFQPKTTKVIATKDVGIVGLVVFCFGQVPLLSF